MVTIGERESFILKKKKLLSMATRTTKTIVILQMISNGPRRQ